MYYFGHCLSRALLFTMGITNIYKVWYPYFKMPYKDLEKRRECRRRWYANNRDSEKRHVKRRKEEIKKWFEKYKLLLKCSKCSENHLAVLEFHHNMKNKEMDIADMTHNGYSINRIKKEISKCVVLCANCHRKEHYKTINNNI